MDEVRNILGEFFFAARQKQAQDREEGAMKYPKRYGSISEFEREELCAYKVSWSIDDFFDEVFLSGEMDLDFGEDGSEEESDFDEGMED
jgi:hypothetical protein